MDGYAELDARVGWEIGSQLEISLVGRNLLDDRHPEFRPTFIGTQVSETEREFYVLAKFHF